MSDAAALSKARIADRVVPIVAVAFALLLAWRAIVAGMAAWEEGGFATLRGRMAPPSGADAPEADWRARLARDPTDNGALMMLALDLEREGKTVEARAAVAEALRLAPSHRQTLIEAAAFQLRTGDEARALDTIRRLADLYPDAWASIWPALTAILESGRHDAAIAVFARDNPSWWTSFFDHACRNAKDADSVGRAYAARVAAGRVSVDERRCMIGRLQREGRWASAYQAWLNSLPASERQRVGFVFNGEFETPISNLGFDWTVLRQEGVRVEATPTRGATGQKALRVEFVNKRWAGPPVQQVLLLFPGRYRFEGRGRADRLDTWLGIQWALYCQPEAGREPRQLVRSGRFRGASGWESWDEAFVVPKDCPVQVLRLELANPRQDADTPGNVAVRLQGVAWFDDFRMRSLD